MRILTKEEMEAARASSLNAHYTALPVIGAIWHAMLHLGLGSLSEINALDPSAGVGHFKSSMPELLRERTCWTEIELDALTASILKLLHPDSKVFPQGFEDVDFPQNWFDLAISNVPSGITESPKKGLAPQLRKTIHDFFFATPQACCVPAACWRTSPAAIRWIKGRGCPSVAGASFFAAGCRPSA